MVWLLTTSDFFCPLAVVGVRLHCGVTGPVGVLLHAFGTPLDEVAGCAVHACWGTPTWCVGQIWHNTERIFFGVGGWLPSFVGYCASSVPWRRLQGVGNTCCVATQHCFRRLAVCGSTSL